VPATAPTISAAVERRQRSLASYFLMPRPKDLVKAFLIPATYVIGVLSAGTFNSGSLLRAVVVLCAVELLIYPARYQWNDVRGFSADQQHPSAKDRGRLPGPLARARSHVLASCAVMALRMLLTGLLVIVLPGLELAGILAFATIGVFGVAIVYELLRSMSTGRTGQIPAPVSTGIVLIWAVTGAGYAVRGLVGLALAIDLTARPTLAAAATVTLWAYGIAFVTSRWALEATAFASIVDGCVQWHARSGQAREHLLALVRWLPTLVQADIQDVKQWAPLRDSDSIRTPWHSAIIVAGGAGALTGRMLCGLCPPLQGLAIALIGAAVSAAAAKGPRWRAGLVLLGATAVYASLILAGAPHPAVGVLPWLSVMCAYLFFSTRTMEKLGRPNLLSVALRAIGSAAGRLIIGDATWEAVRSSPIPDAPT
jgi:hypothetical protein